MFFLVMVLVGSTAGVAAAADSPSKSDASRSEPTKSDSAKVDYVLQPQDMFKIQAFQEQYLTREVRVSQEFTVTLPLIETVNLKGKTARQAQELIRDLYDRDYLVKPQVTLIVVDYSKRTVSVFGQVNKPGLVQFPPEKGLTLVDAIAGADGGTRLANLKKVTLKRTYPDGTTTTDTINVEDLMKGDTNQTWPLQPGDMITVPERSI